MDHKAVLQTTYHLEKAIDHLRHAKKRLLLSTGNDDLNIALLFHTVGSKITLDDLTDSEDTISDVTDKLKKTACDALSSSASWDELDIKYFETTHQDPHAHKYKEFVYPLLASVPFGSAYSLAVDALYICEEERWDDVGYILSDSLLFMYLYTEFLPHDKTHLDFTHFEDMYNNAFQGIKDNRWSDQILIDMRSALLEIPELNEDLTGLLAMYIARILTYYAKDVHKFTY